MALQQIEPITCPEWMKQRWAEYRDALVERRRFEAEQKKHFRKLISVVLLLTPFLMTGLMRAFPPGGLVDPSYALMVVISALCIFGVVGYSNVPEDKILHRYPGVMLLSSSKPHTLDALRAATIERVRQPADEEIVKNEAIRCVAELAEEIGVFNDGLERWKGVVGQGGQGTTSDNKAILLVQADLLQTRARLELRIARAEALFQVKNGASTIPAKLRIEDYRVGAPDSQDGEREALREVLASVEAVSALSPTVKHSANQ